MFFGSIMNQGYGSRDARDRALELSETNDASR
jgi:hypothetical protein